jgi:hypothetical protein
MRPRAAVCPVPRAAARVGRICGASRASVLSIEFAGPRSLERHSPEALMDMMREFGERHGLGALSDESAESGALQLAAGTFLRGDWITRTWYVSDGVSFAKVT